MTGKPGVFLTAEQSVRLAVVDNAERAKMIATIVAGLRQSSQGKRPHGPHHFYVRPISAG